MKFHDTLNPKIWNEDNTLKSEVNDKLLEIANAFMEFLEVPEDSIEDILIVGSSANYNYTDFSDIDVHLIVDYDKVHEDCPIVQGYLWAFKTIFNDEHDITIYDIPVELYAEDSKTPRISNGVYSLKTNEWLSKPEKIEVTVDDTAVKKKYEELKETIDKVDDSEKAIKLLKKIYDMRKSGLQEEGEFSIENLVFKELRNNKDINKLWELKRKDIDDKLSLNEKFSTIDTGSDTCNDSLKYNLYQRETKGRFSEVVLMSPDAYIELCDYGFSKDRRNYPSYTNKNDLLLDRTKDTEDIEELKIRINSDEELEMPYLEFGDVNTDSFYFYQEGLHRAIAAKELGLKEIPVLLMFSGRKGLKALRKTIKGLNFKQITDNWTNYDWQNKYVNNASEIYECRINELSAWQFKGTFDEFYNKSLEKNNDFIISHKQPKQSFIIKDGFRIISDAITHTVCGHNLTTDQWEHVIDLVKDDNNIIRQEESFSPRFNGKPVFLYKLSDGYNFYGMCVEYYPKKLPIITTAFISDSETEMDNWFKRNDELNKKKGLS